MRRTIMMKSSKREKSKESGNGQVGALEEKELAAIVEQTRIIRGKELELVMLKAGLNTVWRALQVKYNLPPEISVDYSTGKLYE